MNSWIAIIVLLMLSRCNCNDCEERSQGGCEADLTSCPCRERNIPERGCRQEEPSFVTGGRGGFGAFGNPNTCGCEEKSVN